MQEQVGTPYKKAKQQWDLRMGDAIIRAKYWRMMALGLLCMSFVLVIGIIYYASQPKQIPYVIEVSQNGEALYKGDVGSQVITPSEKHIRFYLKKFIEYTRTLSSDVVVVKKQWRNAYHFLTPTGSSILSTYSKEMKPLENYKDFRIDIKFTSILEHSQYTRQVNWFEYIWNANGELVSRVHWRGIFKYEFRFPSTAEHVEQNPLGFFIDTFNWTEVQE